MAAHIYNIRMNEITRALLIDLNRTFYQTFAHDFSATRQRLQPGVMSLIEKISGQNNILDIGCGNCQLGKVLVDRGYQGLYTGLDSNAEFLEIARRDLPENDQTILVQSDITTSNWNLDLPANQYDLVLAFAVLHHIPGSELRKQILLKIADLTPPGARFFHSEWQFLNSPRLISRIQPWESIDITPEDIEDGDYLVDWRAGGHGLRYVHIFDLHELETLALETGFEIIENFHSDGEGRNLGLYQIWKRL
jgi:tRNA (uracil-5-)-methyltransferase TRM9